MERFISIYAESTPNPESLKFMVNGDISQGLSFDFPDKESAVKSPLAEKLFEFPFVKGVFINQNYVTITKDGEYPWVQLIPKIRAFMKEYLEAGNAIFTEEMFDAAPANMAMSEDSDIVIKIKNLLANSVKPVVEMDGGAIDFKSYAEGKVILSLRGSCSGCPSSMVTLKGGIEALLKRLIPEIKEVEAEAL